MSQETNLNVSPYFDDFDPQKDYYKVLFKPGYPVQARELNTLQSIAQNQSEQFGKHIFKEGSVVIPGQLKYENPLYAVQIESEYNGIPVSVYFNDLKGIKIKGLSSGVTAEVVLLLPNTDSEKGNYTLYVKYLGSGGENFDTKVFSSSETLILESDVSFGTNSFLQTGEGFANTISENAISEGSAVTISKGVYFIRGVFAKVETQTILLDQYGIDPSYKVGFDVLETIVNSDDDETLFDNAKGFLNFAAPGADRFKIELKLSKREVDDLNTDSFVEILRINGGIPQFFDEDPQYNILRDQLARRTFDESGDYFVKPFTLFVRDSLNDRTLSDGIYFEDQKTVQGNIPSEDSIVYQIGPGKAYVQGYDVETISATLLDAKKARTTKEIDIQAVNFNTGSLTIVNNVYGSITPGLGTDSIVKLMDSRIGATPNVAAGTTIGYARVYDFVPESSYIDDTSRFELRLFDVQTFTTIGLTSPLTDTLNTPAFIEGKRSGSSGYLVSDTSSGSNSLTLYQVGGTFLENEPFSVNGIDNSRLISSVTDYSISDVKSVNSQTGISTFNADTILSRKSYISSPGTTFNITGSSGGISTVSAGLDKKFTNLIKIGDIISYSSVDSDPIFNKVTNVSVGGTFFEIESIESVSGVCNGQLSNSTQSVTNILKIQSNIPSSGRMMTKLNNINVSSLNFTENEILQRRTFTGTFNLNSIEVNIPSEDTDIFFESFDEDKYVLSYTDGSYEKLRRDQFLLDISGKTVTLSNLTKSSGDYELISTVKNLDLTSKSKKLNKTSSITIQNSKLVSSGIGTTTLNDGLNYSNLYGTRVQDRQISLNVPDVLRFLAIYESTDTLDPILPNLTLSSFSGPSNINSDFIIGEEIRGKSSGAVGLVVSRKDTDKLEYVHLNTFKFSIGEVIVGKESSIEAIVSVKVRGSKNVSDNYFLDDGQRDTLYDYSRLVRKRNVEEPKRKLKVIFQNYTIDSSDTGEVMTINSYATDNFKHNVPYYANTRLSDFIDIRPRVGPFSSSTKSPFEFDSRNFSSSGQYSNYIIVPGENITLNYSYYLGRIDKVILNPDGKFEIIEGIPSDSPVIPNSKTNSLDIANIYIPPYTFNTKNVSVDMSEHKRYRMKDISLLENRINRLEKYTTLSLLELKTETLTIKDADTGLDRFKCGFFVDNFSNSDYQDKINPSLRIANNSSNSSIRPKNYTTSIDLQLGSEAIDGVGSTFNPNVDQSYVSDLGSIGIRKTGDLVTLDYDEIVYYDQPYASKTESVTPFLVRYWEGFITLTPPIDSWIEEVFKTSNNVIENETINVIPDENITIVNDVVIDEQVAIDETNVQLGSDPDEWILNAQTILNGITSIGGYPVSPPGVLNSNRRSAGNRGNGITSDNKLRLTVDFNSTTQQDRDLISQLLPPDAANDFFKRIDRGGGLGWGTIIFDPFGGNIQDTDQTTDVVTTQEVSQEVSVTSITIPPEITINESTSESTSNFTETVRFTRSRNIEFDVRGLKPVTRFYPFFEGIDISNYIVPKLLEIEMISGKFEVGETIVSGPFDTEAQIAFRLCKPNHKTGPFDGSVFENNIGQLEVGNVAPTGFSPAFDPGIYTLNPYTQQIIENTYSESSTFLNVDTLALQLPAETEYFGLINEQMTLIGNSSGAVAKVTKVRLISDNAGRLIGSIFIPNPNVVGNPKWINGENTFTVIDTPNLSDLGLKFDEFIPNQRVNESSAEAEYISSGIRNIEETTITTTRNITIIPERVKNTTNITNTTINTTTATTTNNSNNNNGQFGSWEQWDPLAQSFYVRDASGIFLTSCDIYFETKDNQVPVTFQIRPMIAGVPSTLVVPFSEVTLEPSQVNLSIDGSVPTRIRFPSPVYLNGPKEIQTRQAPIGSQQSSEYAIVLLSGSPNYRVFISELGQNDITTGIKLSQQYTLGSLFKSQNGSVWTPSQLEDLKYKIYRANFKPQGLVRFFNPTLAKSNKKITVTGANQLLPLSKKSIVGFDTTTYDQDVVPGVSLVQGSATGTLVAIGGSILVGSGASVLTVGTGYSTSATLSNISLESVTGDGFGAVAELNTNSDGQVNVINITDGGNAYTVGDVLVIPEDASINSGFGARFQVTSIGSTNTFIVEDIQGQFSTGITTISYINSSGITTYVGPDVKPSTVIDDQYNTGLHMKIYHVNHGMHSPENYLRISEMRPTFDGGYLSETTTEIIASETEIGLEDATGFDTFEGNTVDSSNPGYALIGKELVEYNNVVNNTLQITQRSFNDVRSPTYPIGSSVEKYEFNGISLRRINKVHNLSLVDQTKHPTNLNSYHVKLEMGATDFEGTSIGVDRTNDRYFLETVQKGRSGTNLSSNIQYEAITPNFATIVPSETSMDAKLRSFAGTSVGGNENSFTDLGFEDVSIGEINLLSSPRFVCSKVNEEKNIGTLSPGSKSLTMEILMNTNNSLVSPVIDLVKTNVILTSNLVNNPNGIGDNSTYATSDNTRTLFDDDHAAIYISKPVRMKLPANSLKVFLSASRTNQNDVRVLYRLFRSDSTEISQNYELFPGYSNYSVDGQGIKRVIDNSLNDGSSDSKVTETSNQIFRDYEYSVDDLPEFDAFSIKIVMASENQAVPPEVKELRAIATIKPKG